jgi:DNA-binding NarL/FixJ family response regulator
MSTDLLTKKIKNEFKDGVRVHRNGHGLLEDINMYKDLDLVIVDHQYSKENLVDALKTIRRKSPNTEVVVLSSDKEKNIVENIKKAGAYDFIYKDRAAYEKLIYVIRSFWTRKELLKENIRLKMRSKKSRSTAVAMVLIVIGVLALLGYLIFKP